MSRIRYIKPGFFTNEDLGDCQPLARLLFAGLWCIADREGRLEDRPRRIHVEVLPYDSCDCNALLGELVAHGLIIRYAVDGQRYIAIPSWSHHQHPHQRESESHLPSPDEAEQDHTGQDQTPPSSTQSTAKAMPKHSQGDAEPGSNGEWGMGNGLTPLSDASASDALDLPSDLLPAIDDGFDAFWATYPRREGSRPKAHSAWKRLSKGKRRLAQGVATVMREMYERGAGPEKRYIPLPTTYLNGERWDEWREGPPAAWNPNGDERDDLDAFMRSYAKERGLEYEPC